MKVYNQNRFNNVEEWITSNGNAVNIEDMETNHLINALRMFREKPSRTMNMLIHDAEQTVSFFGAEKSIMNHITSMSESELIEYAMNSNLAKAMIAELEKRGVNVENVLQIKSE